MRLLLVDFVLDKLECLARYGLFDIVLGLGIIGYIKRVLQQRTVREIEDVEVRLDFRFDPRPNIHHKSKLYIVVENCSSKPLYIYKARFHPKRPSRKPGSPQLRMSTKSRIIPGGWYAPFVEASLAGGDSQLPRFVKTSDKCAMYLAWAEEYSTDPHAQSQLLSLIESQSLGTFKMHCILGAEAKILKTKI